MSSYEVPAADPRMARSARFGRRRMNTPEQGLEAEALDEEEQKEIMGNLTEAERQRREELEKGDGPMRAELKHLEKRWTKKGRAYIAEPREDDEVPEDKINWYDRFALCVTRQLDPSNRVVTRTSLQVNSAALKAVLRDVIGEYPGISFHTANIAIDFPPRCLFHYLPELRAERARLEAEDPDSDAARHLPILLAFTEENFHDTIAESDNLREQGLMSYEHLWTIFRPGDLVYDTSVSGRTHPRVFRLLSADYMFGQNPAFQLQVEFVDFDGGSFGARATCLSVGQFGGAAPVVGLSALPLRFHPGEAGARARLVARGRKWEAHVAGQHFCEYRGVAVGPRNSKYNVDGRVMLDTATFHRINADQAFGLNRAFPLADESDDAGADADADGDEDEDEEGKGKLVVGSSPPPRKRRWVRLTDDQCLVASPMVRGFSFAEKLFLDFFIDRVSPVEWNTECFSQLVLPDSQKELVQALVEEHTQRDDDAHHPGSSSSSSGFDDIVRGKGRGLILVLHGPPGVGKTLTAECVAEHSRRPLYIVTSGDLGTNSRDLDARLSRALDLASTWKAVMLIDEADVFLERRSLHDLERNSLVTIFLRTLEYYAGILFMTTNRVRTFDDAFKSRIHVPLRYGELPPESRAAIWRNFVSRGALRDQQTATASGGRADIDDDGYRELAQAPLNGRQIKNVVRTAKSLAAHKHRRLDLAQLKQVMEIQMAFERELEEGSGDIDAVEH